MSPLETYLLRIQLSNFFRQLFPWTLKRALSMDDPLEQTLRCSSNTLRTSWPHTEKYFISNLILWCFIFSKGDYGMSTVCNLRTLFVNRVLIAHSYKMFPSTFEKLSIVTFNFISPWRKWLWSTRNVRPRVAVSRPSRPEVIILNRRSVPALASSPFIYQSKSTAGFDRPDVQFKFTQSPIWYFARPPVIVGSLSGKSEK